MKVCFALLLIVAKSQFPYPEADKFPGAECVKKRDKWVEDRVSSEYSRTAEIIQNDKTYPDCNHKDGNYISKPCKLIGQYKAEYCHCVNIKTGQPLMVYSDSKRTKLEELSYSNFPLLFKNQKFTRDSFGCNRVNELMRNSKYTRPIVPSLGLLCSPMWTDNQLCISVKTRKCTKISKICPKFRQVRGTGEMVTSKSDECILKKCDRSWIPIYRAVKQKFLAKDAAKNQKTKRENKRKSKPAVVMS